MGRRKKDWDIPHTQQHELKLMKKQLKFIKLISKSDRQLRLLRRKNNDLILAENLRAAAAKSNSEAATDSNQVSVDNTVDVLDSAVAIMDTVAPKDSNDTIMDSNDTIMDSNVTIVDSAGPTLMEPGFDDSYQPSCAYAHEPESALVEPIVPVHLISYVREQLQADWEETEKRLNEKRQRRRAEKQKARKQSAQEHLDWWKEVEPIVLQSYQRQISETGKPHSGRFDFDDYCGCNCVPRCEIQLICLVGSFS
jgi:hypothetical protein